MTCIAAVVQDGVVWMGGDRMTLAGTWISNRATEKVWYRESGGVRWLFGETGLCAASQAVQHLLTLPSEIPPENGDLVPYLVRALITPMRSLMKDLRLDITKDEQAHMEASFLFALRGQLFEIDDSYHVHRILHPFATLGSGKQAAFGSLFTSAFENPRRSPEERVRIAICSAAACSTNIGSESFVLHV